MRHTLLVLTIATFGLFAPLAHAQTALDPSETFFNGYKSVKAAEELENQQRFGDALAKYRYAGSLFDQLHEQHPQWQMLIVDYRRKRTAEAISRLEGRINLDHAGQGEVIGKGGAGYEPSAVTGLVDSNNVPVPPEAVSLSALPGGETGGDMIDQAAMQIRQQMATLRNDLEKARTQLDAVQSERARLATQLHELMNKPPEEGSNAALREEAEQAKAAAARAREQLQQAVANEKTLAAQLAQAQQETGDAALVKRMEKLQNDLDDARADREVAQEQEELISRKMAELAKRPDLSTKLEEVHAENAKLTKELEGAREKIETLAEAEKKLIAERDAQKAENVALSKKLTEADKKAEAQAAELAAAEERLVAIVQERDAMAKERDTALEQLVKASKGKEELDRLFAENGELMKKLDEAQKTIASLEGNTEEKTSEINDLKEKLTSVQLQLEVAQAESESSKGAIEGLQKQLAELKSDPVALLDASEEQQKLAQENELLRGIVVREMKEQARREQARKLIAAELARLQVRSEALNEQVEFLGQPSVNLTASERALFKGPQMEIIDNEANALTISIASPLVDAGEASSARQESAPGDSAVKQRGKGDLPAELQPQADEAKAAFDGGNYKEATRLFEKIVNKAPGNAYAISSLGVAQFRSGEKKQAEQTLKKAVALAPDDAFSYATLGIIYFQQNKYDEAVNALTRSLALNPKNPTAHNYLGVTAAQKGWAEAAQKEIETAIQLDPSYADAHFNLAVVLATTPSPNKEKARVHYKKAMKLGAQADKALEALLQ